MNYVARHHGRKTESLMESSGVLSGEAFKLFRGTIDFVKAARVLWEMKKRMCFSLAMMW